MDKTIKIFVASSNELDYERQVIGNLVRHLNDIYERRGLRIKLDEWEPLDNNNRNTEEYNTKVRESNMYLALLHRQYDNFVIDEFNVARGAENTKPYVYFKEVNESKSEEKLDEFKDDLSETEYFWINFTNRDTLRFHFVMQFHLVEDTLNANDIKVEDGKIWLEGKPFLHANELSFVGSNTLIKQWSERLNVLEAKENKNDDENREYFELKDKLQNLQKEIINVAKQMARYHGQRITIRLTRAINAFDAGDIQKVSRILAQAPQDGKNALQTYQQATEVQQQSRENVINSIKEIALLASNTMADMETIPSADERVKKAHELYAQADEMAQAINYDPKEYIELLNNYAYFLFGYGKYKEAEEVCLRLIALCKNLIREENLYTSALYHLLGLVYTEIAKYDDALTYHSKALEICKEVSEKEHFNTAVSYICIGSVYDEMGKYNDALWNCSKALEIFKNVFREENPHTANAYYIIGSVYNHMGKYNDALWNCSKALEIYERVFVKGHHYTANVYNNIGCVYYDMGKHNDALWNYSKALEIFKNVFREEDPHTANVYNNIGVVYGDLGKYEDALKNCFKSLEIRKKVLGEKHPHTATSYRGIGIVYDKKGEYDNALVNYSKALEIYEKVFGKGHLHTASFYNLKGGVYTNMGKHNDALWNCSKALQIRENKLGKANPDTASSYHNLGNVHINLGKYYDALVNCSKALKIYEEVLPSEDPKIANVHFSIGVSLLNLKRYKEAKEHLLKALDIYKKEPSKNNQNICDIVHGINVIDGTLRGAGAPKGGISFKFNKWN